MAKSLQNLFAPKSIVIVGASHKKGKIGTILVNNLKKFGYRGKVYYVNPSYSVLKLKRCYSTISAIKKPVDVAVVAVPAKFVADVIKDGAPLVKNFVVISAGFSEIGQEGAMREKQLAQLAKKYKVNILGPNCLGFISPALKLNASFAGDMPESGNIAFVSQSGALAVAMMDMAKAQHLQFSNIISIGNKMQIDEAALIEFLGNDRSTAVIGMYLEGIKDGKKFLVAAQAVSKKKPIVILKAGKTEKAQKAISSHTGALAGSDVIMDSAFEKAGIIRAKDLEEFLGIVSLASFQKPPKNKTVGVVTNAGGAGVLTTDAFKGKAIELADLSDSARNSIKSKLPLEASAVNPIDVLGDADVARYVHVFSDIEKEKLGTLICILTPQDQTPVQEIARALVHKKHTTSMTTIGLFIGGHRIYSSEAFLKQNNIPNFSDPERAVAALDAYYKWSLFAKEKKVASKMPTSLNRKKQGQAFLAKIQNKKRTALLFTEGAELMNLYGIPVVQTTVLTKNTNAANLRFPVVVKVDSDQVLHKSDKQGVMLNIKADELSQAIAAMQKNFPKAQVIAQPMQAKQTELIVGMKRDPIFGAVVVVGLGGIYTEVFKMVDFFVPPMGVNEIERALEKSKLGFLFAGLRGQKPYNIKELASIIASLMQLGAEQAVISEIDINPLFIYNDNRSAIAVDIKVLL